MHHLEFGCGIIANEMKRAKIPMVKEWYEIAQRGVCTMDAEIGRWLCMCFGRDAGPPESQNTMRLKMLAEWLVPSCEKLVANVHTAAADAQLHRLLYFEILKLAGLLAANGAGPAPDVHTNNPPSGSDSDTLTLLKELGDSDSIEDLPAKRAHTSHYS